MWQKLSRCYPLQIELISLFLLFMTTYVALASYPALPVTIPTHFNIQGLPDRWSSKNSIFALLVMSALLYTLLTFVTILLAVSRDPRKYINIPTRWKQNLTGEKIEELRLFFCRALLGMKLLLQGLTVYLVHGTIQVDLGRAEGLGGLLFLFIVAVVVLIGCMLWKSYRISRK